MAEILMIDDQIFFYEMAREELADEGYRWQTVRTSGEVNAFLEERRPDLILLDLYLLGFEGWGILRSIKHRYPEIPVIILTAYDSFRDDPRVEEADGYVIKDVDMNRLREKIRTALSPH